MTGDWRDRAECAYADPTLFDRPDGWGARIPKAARIAASYCQNCDVHNECGADANENRAEGVRDGMWGVITSHGYRRLPITPIAPTPIPVIHHPSARALPNNPERAAS